MPRKVTAEPVQFDLKTFLATTGVTRRISRFAPGAVIFAQGSAAQTVFYIQDGQVKLSVLSPKGKEAVCMSTIANTAGQMNLSCRWEQV